MRLFDDLNLHDGEFDPLHLSVRVELDWRVEFDHSELVWIVYQSNYVHGYVIIYTCTTGNSTLSICPSALNLIGA